MSIDVTLSLIRLSDRHFHIIAAIIIDWVISEQLYGWNASPETSVNVKAVAVRLLFAVQVLFGIECLQRKYY